MRYEVFGVVRGTHPPKVFTFRCRSTCEVDGACSRGRFARCRAQTRSANQRLQDRSVEGRARNPRSRLNLYRNFALPGFGSVEYTGAWTATPGTAEVKGQGGTKIEESLGVTIARFSDSGALKLAVQNLKQGLPGGPLTAVEHFGGPAYEAEAEKTGAIHISWKDYTAYVSLTVVDAATPSPKVLEALAKVLTETY